MDKTTKKIGVIIQSRMGSERLPGKSLKKVGGKPILRHIIENMKYSQYLNEIILATTELKEDAVLLDLAKKLNISGFAGSENDVLRRYDDAAETFGLDIVVRVTGDNILTDVEGMDKTIDLYLQQSPSLATNGGELGYPLGTAVEVLSAELLHKLNHTLSSADEREHVTLHLYRQSGKYPISYLKAPNYLRNLNLRLTIDTQEDLSLIETLYNAAKNNNENFQLPFIIKYLKTNRELININAHIEQKTF